MVDEFQLVIWSCSSVGLERRPVTAEVAGSLVNPATTVSLLHCKLLWVCFLIESKPITDGWPSG